MKYRLINFLLTGVMLYGSCSTEHPGIPEIDNKDLLTFGLENVESRGISTTKATISEFGVFCFDTERGKWETVKSSATPNKMFNQQVVRKGNVWNYDPPMYWESYENKLHSFFGYSPMAKGMLIDNIDGNNLSIVGTKTTPGIPELQFETIEDVSRQIDLLVAKEHLDLKPTSAVLMNFSHALTRVGFKAFCEIAGTYIEKIEIIDIPYKGTLKMGVPVLWSPEADTKNFILDYGSGIPILTTKDKPTDISTPGRYLMVIPNDWVGNTTAKIKVNFRQAGVPRESEFLIGGTKEEWTQSRSVTYVLDLNGIPNNDIILDRVIIDEWKMGNIIDSDVSLKGERYWLYFNSNGGNTNKPADIELETGTLYKLPNIVPEKAGSTFKGWNTAQNGTGTNYLIGDRVPINQANVTLYAKWE